ncbi:MAG: hypothetical protein WCF18_09750, partial [Chthoniobacteraceae bacterium]
MSISNLSRFPSPRFPSPQSTAAFGTQGQNYLQTDYYYDPAGRRYSTHDPNGTVHETFYDARGHVTAQWQGTAEIPDQTYFPRLPGDPSPNPDPRDFHAWVLQNPSATEGPAGTSMVKVSAYVYDNGGCGDGNLTETQTYYVSGTQSYYDTRYQFDWRDRQVGVLGPDGVATTRSLDNLGRDTEKNIYAAATYNGATHEIVTSSTELRGRSQGLYDSQDRVYESRRYEVDPATGAAGDYLPTDTWYDCRGLVAATRTGGGPIQKSVYDGVGELVGAYTCADAVATSNLGYASATNVTVADTVVAQTQTWYFTAQNATLTATYQRLPGDTTTAGPLDATNSYVTAT